ncbi:MAG: hypothetical protein ACRDJF_07565 [Actinomycetota bacterium]
MMDVRFEQVFPAAYAVEVLESVPDDSHVFERPGSSRSGEVAIEVVTDTGQRWVGVAKAGAPSVREALSGAFSTPTKTGLCVVARGDASLVDVDTPERFEILDTAGPVVAVRPVVSDGLLLLASPWAVTALGEDGVRWQTGRLAIERIRLDEIEGGRLAGVADPDDDEPRDFVVDLQTGRHEGGALFPKPRATTPWG